VQHETNCMLLTSCATRDELHASHKLCNTRRIACFSQVVQHETYCLWGGTTGLQHPEYFNVNF